VHRDLKSENVLVCNRHYTDDNAESSFERSWPVQPLICKLTDFGESRSSVLRTRANATATRTKNVRRGSLVYRAPETFQNVRFHPLVRNSLLSIVPFYMPPVRHTRRFILLRCVVSTSVFSYLAI